jgi:hypothetical protein
MPANPARASSDKLAPYARQLLARCADAALQMHADEVGAEHLLAAMMDEPDCAAHQLVVYAFADPETIADEARALASGISISGSAKPMRFSAHAVLALRGARSDALRRGDGAVEIAHVVAAAYRELEPDLRETFADAGFEPSGLERLLVPGAGTSISERGHLFHHFSDDAKRLLSSAAKLARSSGSPSISAAHLFQCGLQYEARIERAAGMPASRARIALRGRSDDLTRVPGGPLAHDDALAALLSAVEGRADTLALLARMHSERTPELAAVLQRHKVTRALIERSRSAFSDPD